VERKGQPQTRPLCHGSQGAPRGAPPPPLRPFQTIIKESQLSLSLSLSLSQKAVGRVGKWKGGSGRGKGAAVGGTRGDRVDEAVPDVWWPPKSRCGRRPWRCRWSPKRSLRRVRLPVAAKVHTTTAVLAGKGRRGPYTSTRGDRVDEAVADVWWPPKSRCWRTAWACGWTPKRSRRRARLPMAPKVHHAARLRRITGEGAAAPCEHAWRTRR
jgi:hypothetical protein